MKRIHIFLIGKVQGVGFRHYIRRRAESLGIRGWTRNYLDKVEAVFESDPENIKKIIDDCIKYEFAKVKDIKIDEEEFKNEEDFKIL